MHKTLGLYDKKPLCVTEIINRGKSLAFAKFVDSFQWLLNVRISYIIPYCQRRNSNGNTMKQVTIVNTIARNLPTIKDWER